MPTRRDERRPTAIGEAFHHAPPQDKAALVIGRFEHAIHRELLAQAGRIYGGLAPIVKPAAFAGAALRLAVHGAAACASK